MHLSIVTGASRGLGVAIIKGLLEKGHFVHALARGQSDIQDDKLIQHQLDLTQPDITEKWFQSFVHSIKHDDFQSITLINNAGMVTPIKRAGEATQNELLQHYSLNLVTPILLSQLFTKWLKFYQGQKTVVNISSGAAKTPYKGWSAYCSSKAGLDMFTRTFGYEQEDEHFPVKMMSFSPGIMDTQMQKQIRMSSKNDFSEIARFRHYHTEGKLRNPCFVASVLLNLLETEIENGKVYDIKEFL
ncbi:(S)-benzoin forming benzil reductase [Bacillus sp. WMMC1349]|uniref:(S)-benzoin forming benzil reductase n=1 Tax=Bacillus sp. WMMC1349 TaxID=2736254 RepID=UPI0015527060|nr:(S)-benzoin forming benzil reductase [Bacillus sp. WMMC1349]NPC93992.1 (S)-benzoin forming benzil reductase [Bacillus sp. WMMC1349]